MELKRITEPLIDVLKQMSMMMQYVQKNNCFNLEGLNLEKIGSDRLKPR